MGDGVQVFKPFSVSFPEFSVKDQARTDEMTLVLKILLKILRYFFICRLGNQSIIPGAHIKMGEKTPKTKKQTQQGCSLIPTHVPSHKSAYT